ncbi:hypothetical protein [Alicyclobacillus macrosporangiidus]|uniref:Uncharacterized protein n=1 Tax=Alicyclobacillus macrosporangiidus TaxID=392015 RepID=A0A1I7IDP7_9BACL|nr:hypothetical protein [Alicyclobacillus macrosporangiidus]SFU71028.1 hypothetical protein SAMN05421543_106156 [Alicyclobacillus macrosporangiidus]
MRVFSRKSLMFHHPTGEEAPVTVRAHDFSDVPDWVAHSTMFRWALDDGVVSVIESKADEVQAEKAAAKRGKAGG